MGQEDEQKVRLDKFKPYQVNSDMVRLAAPDVIVMHCLPAHRGEEITGDVIDGPIRSCLTKRKTACMCRRPSWPC